MRCDGSSQLSLEELPKVGFTRLKQRCHTKGDGKQLIDSQIRRRPLVSLWPAQRGRCRAFSHWEDPSSGSGTAAVCDHVSCERSTVVSEEDLNGWASFLKIYIFWGRTQIFHYIFLLLKLQGRDTFPSEFIPKSTFKLAKILAQHTRMRQW